jgi:hypothetical protein
MVVTEDAPVALKSFTEVPFGLVIAALIQKQIGHVVDRRQGVHVVVPEDPAATLESFGV